MLMIKLSKVGKVNKKVFRLIISEKSRDPFGRVLENLGSYDPYTKELVAKDDRIKYWISNGAQMTATVNNLLVGKNIIDGKKVTASKPGKKSQKRQDQAKVKQDKKAAAAPEEAPAPKDEVKEEPKEEAKAEEVKVEETKEKETTDEKVAKGE